MKIIAERKPLAEALSWVAQVVPRNPNIAVLAGLRMTATEQGLTLRAFDYDTSHQAHLDVEMASPGDCLVSAAFVASIVSSLKGEVVELVLDGEHLTITCGRSTYRTQTMRLDDYPSLPEFPAVVGHVDSAALAHIVNAVKGRIDDASPYEQVRGLHLEGGSEEVVAVGANRASVAAASWPWVAREPFEATIPSKAVLTALKGLAGEVEVGYSAGLFGLRDSARTISMRAMATDFVKWEPLIRPPHADSFAVEIDTAELLDAVKRAASLADDDAATVALHLRTDELEISALGAIATGSEVLDVASPEEVSLGLNSRYLTDVLAVVPSGAISVGVLGARRPIVIRPIDHPRMAFVIQPKDLPGGTR